MKQNPLAEYRQLLEDYCQKNEELAYQIYSGLLNPEDCPKVLIEGCDQLFSKATINELASIEKLNLNGDIKDLELIRNFIIDTWLENTLEPLVGEIIEAESNASFQLGDREVPYEEIDSFLADEENRDRRKMIEEFRQTVIRETNKKHLEIFITLHENAASLVRGSYIELYTSMKQFEVNPLVNSAKQILKGTESFYHKNLGEITQRMLGLKLEDLRVFDIPYLFRGHEFDECFPSDLLIKALQDTCAGMGLTFDKSNFDLEKRPGKSSRALCVPIQIPEKVIMVVNSIGGYKDYQNSFHELGHFQHFINIPAATPFEHKRIQSKAIQECFAFLFEHFIRDEDWHEVYLGKPLEPFIKKYLYINELLTLRRNLGMFLYEVKLHADKITEARQDDYERILSDAFGFPVYKEDYLVYLDWGFYSADYIKGWMLESQLRNYLQTTYGKRWFLNKRVGEFLIELWNSSGQVDLNGFTSMIGSSQFLGEELIVNDFRLALN